ncbi:MAG: hypothetical protein ACJ78Z_15530, partial [Myxococcales bacterium]
PNTTELAREGHLEDRIVMYRHDLLPGRAQFKNPHAFIFSEGTAVMVEVARAAQNQIATFFASDGAEVIDPDGAGVLFEVPAATLPGDFDFGYTL